MYQETPIICGKCGKDTGLKSEHFTNYNITHDICCPNCGAVVIACTKVIC